MKNPPVSPLVPLLAAALALALVPACGGGGGESAAPAAPAEPSAPAEPVAEAEIPEDATIYTVRGVYLGPVFDGEAMKVDHEAIDGYMDAMTMAFRLHDPSEQQGLAEGDKIRFRYVVAGVASFVDRVEKLPEDTELQLAGGS